MADEQEKVSLVNGTASYSRTEKIRILIIVIEQMKLMIKENQRQIGLGNDVENRTRLIGILEDEIRKNTLKINKLRAGEPLKLNYFQRWSDEDDI